MKLIIQKENWYKSGIYTIKTTLNKRFYIGSAKNFYHRHASHKSLLIKGKHPSPQLQYFVNKHGIDKLYFELIEVVNDHKNLLIREQYYLDTMKPFGMSGYNTNKFSNSKLGTKLTEEQKLKLKNRKPTVLSREAIEQGAAKRRGAKRSEEVKVVFKQFAAPKRKKILQFDTNGNLLAEFEHSRDAAQKLNITRNAIRRSCVKEIKISKGFIFLFQNDETIIDGKIKKEELERRLDNVYRPIAEKVSTVLKKYYKDKRKPILVYNTNGEFIKEYDDYLDAAKELGVHRTGISNCINGKYKKCGGYIFKYKHPH